MMHPEHANQCLFFQWFRLAHPTIVAFAIPNFAHLSVRAGAWLKAEGKLAGVPDLFVAIGNNVGKKGLFIEMKSMKGAIQDSQLEVIDKLIESGYCCKIARSFEEAKKIVEEYLK